MANLKNITEVPEVESLSGSEKVLLNVDGGARQVNVGLIKPKVTKELVYEWNFSLEDEVFELFENIDNNNLLWMTHLTENEDFEIVVTMYCGTWDNENGEYIFSTDDKTVILSIDSNWCSTPLFEGIGIYNSLVEGFVDGFIDDPESGNSYGGAVHFTIYPGLHADFDNEKFVSVNDGACARFEFFDGGMAKSVKIYKITR